MTTVSTITAPIEDVADERMTIRERLRSPGSRPWYIGGASGVLWQAILVISVIADSRPVLSKVLGLALLALFYAAFMLLGPIIWQEKNRTKLIVIGCYWAASFFLLPLIGPITIWLWLLVVSLAAFTGLRPKLAAIASAAVILVQVAICAAVGFANGIVFAPVVTVICAATLIGLATLTRSHDDLRAANTEIARLAVVEERARFGRDLHDVLGHSLTVVAVKSELARRLVSIDPEKAEAEIADIERLARVALADLRLAVSNYREIAFESELVAADTALAAAGITAHLPIGVEPIDPRVHGVFAWVLREGVTNVIRHSGASECRVTVGLDTLTIADDGRGPAGSLDGTGLCDGNGLRGLRERAAEAGAALFVSRGAGGGFELTVRRAP